MISPVMPTNTKILWPWFVIRSMSRSACVIHISAVTLVQMTRNAPKVVRKIYRPMDPMRLRVPAHGKTPARATPCRQLRFRQTSPFYPFLDRPTKWPRQGKPFEYAQQFVNRGGVGRVQSLPPLAGQGNRISWVRAGWGVVAWGSTRRRFARPPSPFRGGIHTAYQCVPAAVTVAGPHGLLRTGSVHMARTLRLEFAGFDTPAQGVLILLCEEGLKLGGAARKVLAPTGDLINRAADADGFKGKNGSSLEIIAPSGLDVPRVVLVGVGKGRDLKDQDFAKLGGIAMSKIPGAARVATVLVDFPGRGLSPERVAGPSLGVELRAYAFERYKTRRKEDEEQAREVKVTILTEGVGAVRKAFASRAAVAGGVLIARDLVNEPANVLYPEELARRAGHLKRLGVSVEILDPAQMKKLGMNALLGVGQGSEHESRTVIMRWNGGKRGAAPVAFVGKGVCFDTGGISIKPASGMEDMKGDMAGAACVIGLMHALAARKARVNAVGAIGLVENMPSGTAQRPGDIVTTMSGQTIEIINT